MRVFPYVGIVRSTHADAILYFYFINSAHAHATNKRAFYVLISHSKSTSVHALHMLHTHPLCISDVLYYSDGSGGSGDGGTGTGSGGGPAKCPVQDEMFGFKHSGDHDLGEQVRGYSRWLMNITGWMKVSEAMPLLVTACTWYAKVGVKARLGVRV